MDGLESSELENLSLVPPTDLTPDQTINSDAPSQRFGITSMTNLISAIQTWAEFDFFRTTIILPLLDILDQSKNENVSQYLRHGVMVKYNTLLPKVIDLRCEMKNPFDQTSKERLDNIAKGKNTYV